MTGTTEPLPLVDLAQANAVLAALQMRLPAEGETRETRNHVVEARWAIMRYAGEVYGEKAWARAWTELARERKAG